MIVGSWSRPDATCSRLGWSRETNATRAPARSKAAAVAAPMPLDAPVTTAVRPSNGSGSMDRS